MATHAAPRPNIQRLRNEGLSHQVLHEARCIVVTVGPAVEAQAYVRYLCTLMRELPEALDYDMIHNFMAFEGAVSTADINEMAATYAARRPTDGRERIVCIASPDPNYRFWAPALDHFLPGRRHVAQPTLEAAWAYLEAARR